MVVHLAVLLLISLLGLVAGVVVNELADLLPGPPGQAEEEGEAEAQLWTVRTCPACQRAFSRTRLLPLADWWLWRGRCPGCQASVRLRYAWTELAVALVWLLFYVKFGASPVFFLSCLYAGVLTLIFVIDLEHHLILDVVSYPAIMLAVPLGFLVAPHAWRSHLGGALFAAALFAGLYVGAKLLYGHEALGFGDVKLALLIGLLTGKDAPAALLYGCLLAGLVAGALLLLRRTTRGEFLPLGAYLCVGTLLALLSR